MAGSGKARYPTRRSFCVLPRWGDGIGRPQGGLGHLQRPSGSGNPPHFLGHQLGGPRHISAPQCFAPIRAPTSVERRDGLDLGQSHRAHSVSWEGRGHTGCLGRWERAEPGRARGREGGSENLHLCPVTYSLMKSKPR